MALPTVEVFDDILMPNGAALGGSLRFVLSGVDVDLDTGIVPDREVTIPLPADGSFTVDLWPNDAGTRGTSYQVFVVLPRAQGAGNAERLLGTFTLEGSPASQRLGPLLQTSTALATVALPSIAALEQSVASAAASSAAAGVASGRLEIASRPQLANFVYSDPGAGEQLVAPGDIIVDRSTGDAWSADASGTTPADYDGPGDLRATALRAGMEVLTPEMFGATGLADGNDDTAAFEKALARSPFLFLQPGGIYKLGDFELPSGATIFSHLGMNHFSGIAGGPAVVRRRNGSGVTAIIDTRGSRGSKLSGFHIKGFSPDGLSGYEAHGIRVGGYVLTLEDLSVYECNHGLGGEVGDIGQNTQMKTCRWGNNIIGVTRIVDTSILGGSMISNKGPGLWLQPGNNYNTVITRVEFNGGGDVGRGVAEAPNLRITDAVENRLNLTNDRGWLAGIRALGAKDTEISGVFRRNGASGDGAEGRCHIYMKNCARLSINIVTTSGDDDGGGGNVSPLYSILADNSDDGNEDITIIGDLAGNETAPILQTNGTISELTLLASNAGPRIVGGVEIEDAINGVAIADGRARAARFETGNIAPETTASAVSVSLPPVPALTHRPYKLQVTLRDNASTARVWYGEFPLILHKAGAGTNANLTLGGIAQEVAFADGPGYITVNGAGEFDLDFSTVTSTASGEAFTITPTNNSTTRTHKLFVEIV